MDENKNNHDNMEVIQKICDNMSIIDDLFNSGVKINTKPKSVVISSLLLLNGIKLETDTNRIQYILILSDGNELTAKLISSVNDDDDIIPSLTYQLNNNLRRIYKWYKTTYAESYKLNTTRLNQFLKENINENLKLDLRRGRQTNANI